MKKFRALLWRAHSIMYTRLAIYIKKKRYSAKFSIDVECKVDRYHDFYMNIKISDF